MTGNAPAHDGPFEQHDTFDMSWVRGPRFTRDERQSFKAANGLTDGQTDLAEASVLYRHMVSPTPASELALTRRPTLSSKLGLSGKLGLNRNFGDKPTHSILETNVKSLSGRMSRKPSTSRSEPFKVEV